jgi:hypothetical protein
MAEHGSEADAPLWGLSAEFETADALLAAILTLRGQRLGRLDAFSPVPLPEVAAALGIHPKPLLPWAFAAALLGGAAMMGLCAYTTIVDYPHNIGGRPLFSWPAFLVPSLSFGMMMGSLAAVGMLLLLNRLPRLNHPAFNIPDFTRATSDRFFLAVEARDDTFDVATVKAALQALSSRPRRITEVPR